MSSTESINSQEKNTASERRAYDRHPIHLPAEVVIDGVGSRSCVIRDYCLGGMLLVFEQGSTPTDNPLPMDVRLGTNDLIGIQCHITLEDRPNKLRFKARIAHTDSVTAGVAFINPDLNALQLIRQFARQNPADEYKPTSTAAPSVTAEQQIFNGLRPQQIISTCNSTTLDGANQLIAQFNDVATNMMFEFAKETTDLAVQNAFFQAISLLTNSQMKFQSLFINAVKQRLIDGNPEDDYANEGEPQDYTVESLKLVEDTEFDKWLAVSSLVNRVEADQVSLLRPLEKRLSVLFDKDIDSKNNPYGPSLFVRSFQDMLENFELAHPVIIKCYDVFRKVFITAAQDIYQELNKYLVEQDVLPVIKREIVRQEHPEKRAGNDTSDNDNPAAQKQDDDTGETQHNSAPDSTDSAQPDKPATPSSTPEPVQQDLYSLVGELRDLQQQLKSSYLHPHGQTEQQADSTYLPATSGPQLDVALPAYSKPELLQALSNINFTRTSNTNNSSASTSVIEQLETALGKNHDSEVTGKVISKQEAYVIDVAENVISSLLYDQQIANSIRPWIEKLGIPIIKMALLDKTLFVDKSNIVRQVINKLATLEILAEAEDSEDQEAIRHAFNWVVDLINTQFDGTPQVFSRALQQLELLGKIQEKSYETNLKYVIADFMREEQQQSQPESDTEKSSADELKSNEWLRRVSRLKEGHWILFDANTDNPKRLKLAWIAERSGKYVFVNVIGRKDRVLTQKVLAALLESSEAVVLDGIDEPVMDRAQYTMLQNLHKQLLHQASHDELTGLINRREFEKSIEEAINDTASSKTKHAICQIDLDKFKIINTTYGYEAGDALIKQFITLIEDTIEEPHILARIGADEFGIILQEMSLDDAMEVFEDIMANLEEFRFEWNNDRISVTISAGLAIINNQTRDTTTVLQSIDSSCALAKEMGGNRIQLFHSGHSRLSRRKEDMLWTTKIDKTLDKNSLFLRCQKIAPTHPQYQDDVHYEILLGLPEEIGGQSVLAEYIRAAEHYNRMLEIDRWVIHNTFQWLADHDDMVSDISGFSINLSGHSLNDENLIDYIYDQVKQTAVPIERVCFEITETAGISNLSDAADFITTIKGTGCKFSLDDFGSGMSSYAYLKSLPVDYLKIDGVFIRNIEQNPGDSAIVKSICEIGHFMDKKVVAEFVQDETTVNLLREIGVDYVQGYGVEKPHLLDDLIK